MFDLEYTFRPEFSARVLGTTSNASANFLIAYCSSPGYVFNNVKKGYIKIKITDSKSQKYNTSAIDANCLANSISTAPAPGKRRAS